MDEKNFGSPDPTLVASRPLPGLSGDASVAEPRIPHALEMRGGLAFIAGDGGAPLLHPASLTNKSRHPDHSAGKSAWAHATLTALVHRYNVHAELVAALESAAASIEQLVSIGRIPANNQGLRDANKALARARS